MSVFNPEDGPAEPERMRYLDEMYSDEEDQAPVRVPHTELSAEALRGVIESFVLREGTDYGERDVSFEEKCSQVLLQLEREEARIMFDPASASVSIVLARNLGSGDVT